MKTIICNNKIVSKHNYQTFNKMKYISLLFFRKMKIIVDILSTE